ncbi:hypothetical protein Tco_1070183 [Tanacetum coccineum]|uniref:Uncharacterized protein n=1 Tax=Tanacetum coccineum TaxID=301880 RepID=A0ABQ5HM36_9ASTR
MTPLAAQLERKPRRDRGTRRGRHSTSSSSAFDQPSSSHLNDDDDDGNDEGTSRASTPSPIRYVNSLTNQVPQVFQNPPNIDPDLEPFYTRQTKIINRQVQLRDEHRDVPPKPLNPQPLQSHPSLDITLSLSPITPLDHTHDTTSPPPPQPPIMGHPLYYNYHDYHGFKLLFGLRTLKNSLEDGRGLDDLMDTQMTWIQRGYREIRVESRNARCFVLTLSYRTSKSRGAKKFFGTERAVGLLSWLEGMEYVLYISKCLAIVKSRLNLMEHTSLDKRSGNCYSPTLGGPK